MSFKLSRNKVNCLASLIVEFIERHEEIDYIEEISTIRMRVFHLIMDELRRFEQIENASREKIKTQKKNIAEGSMEWDILFRKYVNEELLKLGKIWG